MRILSGFNFAISLSVFGVSESASVNKIGASYFLASGVAESASAKASRFTMTTVVGFVHPAEATLLATSKRVDPPYRSVSAILEREFHIRL